MKKFYFASALALILMVSGCAKIGEKEAPAPEEVCGSEEFLSSVISLGITSTKTGELSEQELMEQIAPLFPISIEYLQRNGYDYSEDFDENDPNIILTAFYLLAYDAEQYQTKGTMSTIMDCVVTGAGLKEILGKGAEKLAAKAVAKLAAKSLLKRAVPYVGTAIFVGTTTACLIDNFTD